MSAAPNSRVRFVSTSLHVVFRLIATIEGRARFKGITQVLLLSCVVTAADTAGASPVTYDGAVDFSITNGNPNGTWSYGTETAGGSTFTLLTNPFSNQYGLSWGEVWKNTSGSTVAGVAPGQISLHPLPSFGPGILRWTAPAGISSTVSIFGRFFAGDIGTMQVGIFLNNDWSTPLFQATDQGAFSFVQAVAPGTTIDFAAYGGYAYGNTPIDARITGSLNSVPEIDPAGMGSVLALVGGALGVLERRRRRTA